MRFRTSVLTISFSFGKKQNKNKTNLIQFKESGLILVSFMVLMSWMSYHWSTFAHSSFSSPGLLSINKSVSTFGSRSYWFLKLDLCISSSNSPIQHRVCIKPHAAAWRYLSHELQLWCHFLFNSNYTVMNVLPLLGFVPFSQSCY